MELVTVNLGGKVRRETLHGREYLVAPLTMIVSGVLNGSMGALFYPAEEIHRNPDGWNGVPILLNHPTENGLNVSGRSPAVWEKNLLGHVFNATASDGKLTAEGWFDVAAVQRLDTGVLKSLQLGKPLELSTGLFTENSPAPADANHNGKPYQFIARAYRPDHLAILPTARGACSIADGCGVLVNEGADVRSLWRKLGRKLGLTRNAKPSDTADIPIQKACLMLKEGKANGRPLSPKQRGMLGAICGKRDKPTANAAAFGEPGWECAVCNTGHGPKVEPVTPAPEPVTNAESHEGQEMPLTKEQKSELVSALTANCECEGPWKGQDAAALNAMSDDKLMTYKECMDHMKKKPAANAQQPPAPVVNAAPTPAPQALPVAAPLTAQQWYDMAPQEVKDFTRNAVAVVNQQKQAIVARLVANRPQDQRAARAEKLMKLNLEDLQDQLADMPAAAGDNPFAPNYAGAAAPVANHQDDSDNILPMYDLSTPAQVPAQKQA